MRLQVLQDLRHIHRTNKGKMSYHLSAGIVIALTAIAFGLWIAMEILMRKIK